MLHLEAIDKALVKQAVFIADAVPVSRNAQGCQGIEKTSGQPAKAAVAEGGVVLFLPDLLEVVAHLLQHILHLIIKTEIDKAVAQGAADEKLQRKVVDPLLALCVIALLR
jgi:hypothetical protein